MTDDGDFGDSDDGDYSQPVFYTNTTPPSTAENASEPRKPSEKQITFVKTDDSTVAVKILPPMQRRGDTILGIKRDKQQEVSGGKIS